MGGGVMYENIDEVRRAVEIYEVISGYFPLKRKGAGFWACCPFHEEKTASLHVHPERQSFHCFGCGKGGDVISFTMEYEKVDFPEAVRILAQHAGIELRVNEQARAKFQKRQTLEQVVERAAKCFRQRFLSHPEAGAARDYLASRGFADKTLEDWCVGYALDSWDDLLQHMRKAGIPSEDVFNAGLVVKREGGSGYGEQHYDRFRGRIIFPISDARGRIVGFAGRTMQLTPPADPERKEPKYINTPETELYKKRDILYGLHNARKSGEKMVAIVEGYTDKLMLYQHGIENVVALCGTEFTRNHALLLRKHFDRAIVMLDPDLAGERRMAGTARECMHVGMRAGVLLLPAGKDPDEAVLAEGSDRMRERIRTAASLYDFELEQVLRGKDPVVMHPDEKLAAIKQLEPFLAYAESSTQRLLYVHETAKRLGITFGMALAAARERITPRESVRVSPFPSVQAEFDALVVMLRTEYSGMLKAQLVPEQFTDPAHRAVFTYLVATDAPQAVFEAPLMPVAPSLFSKPLDQDIVAFCERQHIALQREAVYGLLSKVQATPPDAVSPRNILYRLEVEKMKRALGDLEQSVLDAAGKRDGTGVVKLLTDYVSRYREFKTLSGPLSSTAQ